jgi:hypothetical protein
MKILLLFVFVSTLSAITAQNFGFTVGTPMQGQQIRAGFIIDSVLKVPIKDTTWSPLYTSVTPRACLIYRPQDSSYYFNNGVIWNRLLTVREANMWYDTNFIMPTYAAGTGLQRTGASPNFTLSVDPLSTVFDSRYEPIITSGTTGQYRRGDKTWQTLNTTVVPEGSNLYWTTARFNSSFSTKTTTDLSEGTNQYFTNVRARSSISLTTTGTGAATYNSSTGVLNVPTPSVVTPSTDRATAYSSGTVYTLTTTSAKVDFGTTDPVVTLPAPGTYLILTNLKIEYAGLTTLLNACNFKLRRTNNTATDLSNAATTFNVVATLLTGTGGDVDVPAVIYTTTNSNDVIELWANRQNGISVTGNINVGEASIVAIRIF